MDPEELAELKASLNRAAEILDCDLSEILDCLKGNLISEEEVGEITYGG